MEFEKSLLPLREFAGLYYSCLANFSAVGIPTDDTADPICDDADLIVCVQLLRRGVPADELAGAVCHSPNWRVRWGGHAYARRTVKQARGILETMKK